MNKRRIVSMLILIALLITNFASFAVPQDSSYVIDNGHGEFKFNDNNISTTSNNSNISKSRVNKIEPYLYQILEEDILSENREYDKLIQVNDTTLLRVKEIKIDLKDSRQVEKYISEYDVNPIMADDIRTLSLKVEEGGNVDDELIVYTPKFKIDKNDNFIGTNGINDRYYYRGYLGYDYMDEIWYVKSTLRWRDIRTGSAVKRYIGETIFNIIEYFIDNIFDTASKGSWSLAKIFAGSPVLVHDGTTGDVHQASLDESKWRKYTSIDMGDGYRVGAWSDRSSHRFLNYLNINGVRDEAYSPWVSWDCDNYNNLDVLAYRYRDLPWGEGISGYEFNNLTYFRSVLP